MFWRYLAALSLLLLCFCSCFADPAALSPRAGHMQSEYDKQTKVVDHWESQANQQIVFSVAIGLIGLFVGALQSGAKPWIRFVTIFLGLTVSALTLLSKTVYPADSRTLQRSVFQGRSKLRSMQTMLDGFDPTSPVSAQVVEEGLFFNKSGEIDQIGQDLLGLNAKDSAPKDQAGAFLIRTVYAQSAAIRPSWTKEVPHSDALNTYVVGEGKATSLSDAKQASTDDAVKKSASTLAKASSDALSPDLLSFVKGVSETSDAWFSYDKTSGTYHYFTRLRMTNKIHALDLSALLATEPQSKCATVKIEDHQVVSFPLGADTLWVYLAKQTTDIPGRADLYVLAPDAWKGEARKLNRASFVAQLPKDGAGSYVEQTLTNMPMNVRVNGKTYSAKVETHYVRGFANVTLCMQ